MYYVGKIVDVNDPMFSGQVFTFETLAEAEAKIEEFEQVDPEGVHSGQYYIDGPEEES